jgi:hypothetical protein
VFTARYGLDLLYIILCSALTVYLCVLCGSEKKQLLFPYTTLTFLGAFAKLRKATISFVMSVCSYGIIGLPLDGFSLCFIHEYFSKICRENSSFIGL